MPGNISYAGLTGRWGPLPLPGLDVTVRSLAFQFLVTDWSWASEPLLSIISSTLSSLHSC